MADPQPPQPQNPAATPDLTGTTVGRFRVRARLGTGGMGEVYRAEDTKLKRSVALKRMAPQLRADERFRRRFLKEAERASRLTDQRIAGLYDVLEEGGEIFLVMEYVEGQTLRQRLGQPLDLEQFLAIAGQCAEALVAAHEKGIVHRDLKPENIMLTPAGGVKILDFGVAKRLPRPEETAATETLEPTAAGGLSGTPAYMAPETLLEKEADGRADIFSLGVVFYEALTGRHPFLAGGFLATSDRILHEAPRPVGELNPRVPAELERIVSKMLAKRPEERYATAADLLVDLRALQPGAAVPPPRPRGWRLTPWERRGLVAAGVVLVAGLAYWHFQTPVVEERSWILVADLENQSGEPLFERTASELLAEALRQSRYVNVVSRQQVREAVQRMGRAEMTTVDAALGQEICQRENYRALVAGTIVQAAPGYQISLQVVDPWKGVPVIVETTSLRSPDDLYAGIERLAQRLRRRLGESLAQIEKNSTPLARATTPSLLALQRYSRALDLYAQGDLDGFVALANSALELDPDFAMAHLYLGSAYERLGNEKAAQQHLARARQGLERVTERERYLILASDFQVQGLFEKAAEQYRLLTEVYPDDLQGYRGLADVSLWLGRREEAVRAQERVLELNPRSTIDHGRLVLYLDRVNRFRDALAAAQKARALGLESAQLHWGTGLAYLGLGEVEAARREFELLRQGGSTYDENLALLYLARVLMYEGRMREAVETLRAGLVLDEKLGSASWLPVRHFLLGRVQEVRGQRAAAQGEAGWLAREARAHPQPETLRRAGLLAGELGDLRTTRQLLALLEQLRAQQDSAYTKSCYYNLKGEFELVSGQTEAAIESQRTSATYFSGFDSYHALGKAYQARGDWRGAIQAFEQFLQFKGELFQDDFPPGWMLTHLELARTYARAGDTRQALRYYDEFLRLWAQADADLPALRAARAERQQLIATQPANSVPSRPNPAGARP